MAEGRLPRPRGGGSGSLLEKKRLGGRKPAERKRRTPSSDGPGKVYTGGSISKRANNGGKLVKAKEIFAKELPMRKREKQGNIRENRPMRTTRAKRELKGVFVSGRTPGGSMEGGPTG